MPHRTAKTAIALSGLALAALALAACAASLEGSAPAAATSQQPASDSAPRPVAIAGADAAAIVKYVETLPAADSGGSSGIDGVQAEYEQAVALFPFPMPDGYEFPAELGMTEPEPNTQYSVGAGGGQAYFLWQGATATAAYEAHQRGDDASATAHLDAIEAAYATDVRRMYIEDVGNGFIRDAVAPARNGDYSELKRQVIDFYVGTAETEQSDDPV